MDAVTFQLRLQLHPHDLDAWTREIQAEGVCDPTLLRELADSASVDEIAELLVADARIAWLTKGVTRDDTDERCERLRSALEALAAQHRAVAA